MRIYLIIFFTVYVTMIVLGHLLFRIVALRSVSREKVIARAYEENGWNPYAYERELGWVEKQADRTEKVTIRPPRAPRLSGRIIPAGEGHSWVICCHDYGSDGTGVGSYAEWFSGRGCHLLIPDLRGSGESGGITLGLGYADHYDLRYWIQYIRQRDPQAEILLFGVGSGAAASLFCAIDGEKVVGVVSDSSYAGLREAVMAHIMARFGAVSKVITNFADTEYSFINGFRTSWRRADLWLQIRKCTVPVLLIHGEEDYFIPVRHFDVILQQAEDCPITPLRVAGAGHAACCHADPEGYWRAVSSFLQGLGWS